MSPCKWMRNTVLTSATSLGLGVIVEAAVQLAPFGSPSVVPALLSALAAFSVLFAAVLLVATFLAGLLPPVSRQMEECRH